MIHCLSGTFLSSLHQLHWLKELQLSHNQFEMQGRGSLSGILGGMLALSTFDLMHNRPRHVG